MNEINQCCEAYTNADNKLKLTLSECKQVSDEIERLQQVREDLVAELVRLDKEKSKAGLRYGELTRPIVSSKRRIYNMNDKEVIFSFDGNNSLSLRKRHECDYDYYKTIWDTMVVYPRGIKAFIGESFLTRD